MTAGLELYADEIDGRLHAVVVNKGRLDNLYVDPLDKAGAWASIYLGRVAKVDARMDAAFVDLGGGQTGLLAAKHVGAPGGPSLDARPGIAKLVQPGQMMTVQIKAEGKCERAHDMHKLPRLTTRLYVFGDFLVHSPLTKQMVIPAQLEGSEAVKKAALKLENSKGGWIVRRSLGNATAEDIIFEARSLLAAWREVDAARKDESAPRLLRAGPDALARALCEYSGMDFEHVHAAGKTLLDGALAWSAAHYPPLGQSKRLRLFRPANPQDKLFETHDIYAGLEALRQARVDLHCGGTIFIEETHALTVIDVNMGSAESAFRANMEAAEEVARQTRLRNLSGAILVDFINMQKRTERSDLIHALEKLFKEDTGSAQVHGFTRLGIVEITRKRRAATLAENWRS